MTVLTIGHSTHSIEDFTAMLKAHHIERLADVRKMPVSRRNPQFNRDGIGQWLPAEYFHIPGLGGLRRPRVDSINTAWKNDSFRGYADYMQTAEFERNLDELIRLAAEKRTAIMCAEALPWQCHRSLIADALMARGIPVEDIFSAGSRKPHRMTPFARIENGRVTYPGLI